MISSVKTDYAKDGTVFYMKGSRPHFRYSPTSVSVVSEDYPEKVVDIGVGENWVKITFADGNWKQVPREHVIDIDGSV